MPRAPRNFADGLPHHVIARANGGMRLFRSARDYAEFLELIEAAMERQPVQALGYCLMPNHLHFVLRPEQGRDLSRFMQWLLTTHAARWHRRHGSNGHVWQGRFKAFAIQDDRHLWTVLRYVERNAVRAKLASAVEDWPWGSFAARLGPAPPAWLAAPHLPPGWRDWVNEPQSAAELDALRRCVNRGAPFGAENWARRTAEALGLASTLRPRGRPPRPIP